jgi:LuxR family maltose regulon positive regulatory protein
MCELRANDLRFSLEEATDYLTRIMRLGLSSDDVAALENRTEGWIAGLKLAALSMQGLKKIADRHDFVENFTGSNRFIQDYLTDEVLKRQSERIREFLVLTSVLKQFNSDLCSFLTGFSNCQEILQQLDETNVFLIPLDDSRRWFRYHHLFSDLLKSRLAINDPEKYAVVHGKAANWFEENGYIDQAINHALQVEDKTLAANLIEKYAKDYLFQSRVQTIKRWMDELPDQIIGENPYLGIYYSWALVLMNPKEYSLRIEGYLERINHWVANNQIEKSDENLLLGQEASIYALLSQPPVKLEHDAHKVLAYLNQAQELLPESEKEIRGMNYVNIGYEYLHLGDAQSAMDVNQTAFLESQDTENFLIKAVSVVSQALVMYYQGEIKKARDICLRELTAVEKEANKEIRSYPILGAIWITDGHLLVEMGDFVKGIEKLIWGIDLLQKIGEYEILSLGHVALVRAYLYSGEIELARETSEKLATKWPVCTPLAQTLRVLINIFEPVNKDINWELVNPWMEDHDLNKLDLSDIPGITPWAETEHLTQFLSIMVFLIKNSSDAELDLSDLGRLEIFISGRIKIAQSRQFVIRELEYKLLLALVLQIKGRTKEAQELIIEAVSLTRKVNFARWFYIAPQIVLEHLRTASLDSDDRSYVDQMIEIIEPILFDISTISAEDKDLMSDREIQILECIADGLSNKEIGERLHLALDTIKGHNRRIFNKLGVNNRAQAVKKAIKLKIIA